VKGCWGWVAVAEPWVSYRSQTCLPGATSSGSREAGMAPGKAGGRNFDSL